MKKLACLLLCAYFPVLITCQRHNGGIIGFEAVIPNIGQVDVDLSSISRLLNAAGNQNGRQYHTQVNGKPVTIEIIDEDQLRMPNHQRTNTQMYWQMMQPTQNFNRQQYPQNNMQRPQGATGNLYITKDTRYANYPNIEVYDVYTGGQPDNQRYPNRRYPNGQLIPNGPTRVYPEQPINHNMPVPTQDPYNIYNNRYPGGVNPWNPNMHDHSRLPPQQPTHQNTPDMMNHNMNHSPYPNNKSPITDNTTMNKNPNLPKEPKKPDSSNVAGYIDKFPVIMLNENEIRK